jgi:hypothetical protein
MATVMEVFPRAIPGRQLWQSYRSAFWMRSDNPRASVAAAQALLDRGFGKPQQSVDAGVEGARDSTPCLRA